jgi:DNA-binding LytR/AlgR family response regulator
MKPFKVALADDEPLARARLSRLLREAGCEVIAELEDGAAVLAWLREAPPMDALFLDISMPGATGLEVMAELPERLPVVFVTAYAEHAVRAFEAAAVDYVLKPLSAERLAKSLARLRDQRSAAPSTGHAQPAAGRYPAKAGDGHVFLELRRTSHFEVEDEIVWAWCGGSRFRTGWSTLAEVELAFPAAGLLRIQRHLLLRPEAVLGLRPLDGGRATIRVSEGLELETSRTATPKLKELLGL